MSYLVANKYKIKAFVTDNTQVTLSVLIEHLTRTQQIPIRHKYL